MPLWSMFPAVQSFATLAPAPTSRGGLRTRPGRSMRPISSAFAAVSERCFESRQARAASVRTGLVSLDGIGIDIGIRQRWRGIGIQVVLEIVPAVSD
jgi:hypothetical protein